MADAAVSLADLRGLRTAPALAATDVQRLHYRAVIRVFSVPESYNNFASITVKNNTMKRLNAIITI